MLYRGGWGQGDILPFSCPWRRFLVSDIEEHARSGETRLKRPYLNFGGLAWFWEAVAAVPFICTLCTHIKRG